MRGVILVGGHGRRLKPFTNRLNKALAPIYCPDGAVPQIFYPLRTLVDSGITDILIVSTRSHCGQLIELLGDGEEYNCKLTYKIQEMDREVVGIAQALSLAKDFVAMEPFAVILGDNYYEDSFYDIFKKFEVAAKKKVSSQYRGEELASIFLKEVEDPERFGVANITKYKKVISIEEKPSTPKSKYAVTGLYLYTPHVFELVPHLKPSKRNELEITDINNYYVEKGKMKAHILENWWKDMGLPSSAKAVQDYLWSKKE